MRLPTFSGFFIALSLQASSVGGVIVHVENLCFRISSRHKFRIYNKYSGTQIQISVPEYLCIWVKRVMFCWFYALRDLFIMKTRKKNPSYFIITSRICIVIRCPTEPVNMNKNPFNYTNRYLFNTYLVL